MERNESGNGDNGGAVDVERWRNFVRWGVDAAMSPHAHPFDVDDARAQLSWWAADRDFAWRRVVGTATDAIIYGVKFSAGGIGHALAADAAMAMADVVGRTRPVGPGTRKLARTVAAMIPAMYAGQLAEWFAEHGEWCAVCGDERCDAWDAVCGDCIRHGWNADGDNGDGDNGGGGGGAPTPDAPADGGADVVADVVTRLAAMGDGGTDAPADAGGARAEMAEFAATVKRTAARKRPNGYVIYDGPSLIDGTPIVAVAVGFARPSKNIKTGGMVQVFIIPNNGRAPSANVKMGTDVGVCGNSECPHRDLESCYVDAFKSVDSVWGAYIRGEYSERRPEWRGHRVRIGAYGDPCALPVGVIRDIARNADGWTGYTHQWRNPLNATYRPFLMASVELASDRRAAKRRGWRTFRAEFAGVDPTADAVADADAGREMNCPAVDGGPRAANGTPVQCIKCMACYGAGGDTGGATPASKCVRDVVIRAHGAVGAGVAYSDIARAFRGTVEGVEMA